MSKHKISTALDKGKQRENGSGDESNAHDMDVGFSSQAFIGGQVGVLQSPLRAPELEELECTEAEYRHVLKAVKHLK